MIDRSQVIEQDYQNLPKGDFFKVHDKYREVFSDAIVMCVEDYINRGRISSEFLIGLMANNFMEAYIHADSNNEQNMKYWADLLYNDIPVGAWGSIEKIDRWCQARREG